MASARATQRLRVLPDFLIIGAQRAGTTSLYRYLMQHPSVSGCLLGKGAHYFDIDYARGEGWYRGHFPTNARKQVALMRGSGLLVGEGSPYYLFHPLVPARVAELLPNVRLIAMLRDPTLRAYSHYRHFVRRGIEPLPTFEAALDAEPQRLHGEVERLLADPAYRAWNLQHFSYVARGLYAEQLDRWLERFPRERLLLIKSEDFFAEPARSYASVESFLGLDHHPPARFERFNAEEPGAILQDTRERLRARFDQPDRDLADRFGSAFRW